MSFYNNILIRVVRAQILSILFGLCVVISHVFVPNALAEDVLYRKMGYVLYGNLNWFISSDFYVEKIWKIIPPSTENVITIVTSSNYKIENHFSTREAALNTYKALQAGKHLDVQKCQKNSTKPEDKEYMGSGKYRRPTSFNNCRIEDHTPTVVKDIVVGELFDTGLGGGFITTPIALGTAPYMPMTALRE